MRSLVLSLVLFAASLHAEEPRMPEPGDCAAFREGGSGYILRYPTYYVLGTITEIYRRQHRMELCPTLGKPRERYTRDDWQAFADAYPCVSDPEQVKEVEAIRVRMRVDEWDTPWTHNHGRAGMLFRGKFLNIELQEGVELDIDGTLLQKCEIDD